MHAQQAPSDGVHGHGPALLWAEPRVQMIGVSSTPEIFRTLLVSDAVLYAASLLASTKTSAACCGAVKGGASTFRGAGCRCSNENKLTNVFGCSLAHGAIILH